MTGCAACLCLFVPQGAGAAAEAGGVRPSEEAGRVRWVLSSWHNLMIVQGRDEDTRAHLKQEELTRETQLGWCCVSSSTPVH